jgi:hypothetical protein
MGEAFIFRIILSRQSSGQKLNQEPAEQGTLRFSFTECPRRSWKGIKLNRILTALAMSGPKSFDITGKHFGRNFILLRLL